MTTFTRRTGTRCLRWLILWAAAALPVTSAPAQEALSASERGKLDSFRAGNTQPSQETKDLCDKAAKWYVARLNDPGYQRAGSERSMSWLVNDLIARLGIPQHNTTAAATDYARNIEKRRSFLDEFGKSLITALEPAATQGGNHLVRINAARMVSEICRAGYDPAAEVCIKILAKPEENDAVKLYALQGLKYLFAIVPDPNAAEKTVFQKQNVAEPTALERRCIQALIDFVFRQPPPDLSPPEVDALFFVRREAVRALALARVQRVKDKGKVVSQPALALLKIARGDGWDGKPLNPPSNTAQGADPRSAGERLEAVIGFCNLFPPTSDRDMNIDYAVYHIGRALQEIAPLYKFESKDSSTPWKVQALFVREALNNWKTRSTQMSGIQDTNLIGQLYDIVDRDILQPIEQANNQSRPDPTNLDTWLREHQPRNKSLFKNDAKSTVDVP